MGGTIELPFGLATSVGSVPCETAREAVELAFRTQPAFPSAPSIGAASGSLLAQATEGIGGVEVLPPGLIRLDPEVVAGFDLDEVTVDLSGPSYEAFRLFVDELAEHQERSPVPVLGVRVSHLGPVTVALSLRAAGVPTECAVAVADAVVGRRAAAMLEAVRSVMPDGVVLMCACEPGLIGAMHPTFPLAPSEVAALLETLVTTLDRHRAAGQLLIGVHVPGRTDWESIISSGVSVISAPADSGLVGWSNVLADFLDRGGRIVWGAVPVDQPLGTSEELLWRRLTALWCELVGEGLDPLLLRSRSLVSPVDGLAHFGETQAERVLDLVESISVRARRQAIGARLSLGA